MMPVIPRRILLQSVAVAAAGLQLGAPALRAASGERITRAIPSSGEELAVVGMGTWQTFDVDGDDAMRKQLTRVLQTFFDHGGELIDSSPMYGSSEAVLGDLLTRVPGSDALFAATKVWTRGRQAGIEQMQDSMGKMGVAVMDLMQIHNLVDWQTHLRSLRDWKQSGRIRYLGLTTSHGRDHAEFVDIMKREPLDFVQFTYSIDNRVAEQEILPIAADRGIATLINRPYQGGRLFRQVRNRSLPGWAAEFDCHSWGQFFLKYILSHPAVTCVIPATSSVEHMRDNMRAGNGRLPDAAARRRMEKYFTSL